jgi:hypothetical protein
LTPLFRLIERCEQVEEQSKALPLPEGEGWGEGKGDVQHPAMRESRNWLS